MAVEEMKPEVLSKSKVLLNAIKNYKIVNISRVLNSAPEIFVDRYGVDANDVFELESGPVFLEIDSGEIIGFNMVSNKNTLVAWLDDEVDFKSKKKILGKFKSGYAVTTLDNNYGVEKFKKSLNLDIKSITIVREKREEEWYLKYPSEIGLIIETENTERLVISSKFLLNGFSHLTVSYFDEYDLAPLGYEFIDI